MEESIYETISNMLGITPGDEAAFNDDILTLINSAFNRLWQVGVGPDKHFKITGNTETWSNFMPSIGDFESVKEYIYLSVKLIFDPPSSGFVTDAMKARKTELEWCLMVQAENDRIDIFHPGMIYNVGDTVIKDGVHYVRIAPQEVPEKWNFRNWKVYDYQDETVPAYDISKNYSVGEKCRYDNKYYVCVVSSTAGAFDADKWVEYHP